MAEATTQVRTQDIKRAEQLLNDRNADHGDIRDALRTLVGFAE